MLELFIALALAAYTVATQQNHPLLLLVFFLIALPGLWANGTGAPSIPTRKKVLGIMMKLARIKRGEKVYDLGCGDGRIVFAARNAGAVAVGYELSLPTYLLAKIRSLAYPGARIELKNFWTQDYRDADVVFCYLLISTMQTFKKVVWPQLKPGCRVVSHAFRMKGMTPTEEEDGVYLYVKE